MKLKGKKILFLGTSVASVSMVNYAKKIYPELTLKVYIKNANATRFYQHNGFKIIAEQTDDDTQEQELLMSWSLECKSGYTKKYPGDS